jgi:hypothetical protein
MPNLILLISLWKISIGRKEVEGKEENKLSLIKKLVKEQNINEC